MTVPTTSSTPTMMTARTVPVSWFAIPRLCLNSIFLVSPQAAENVFVCGSRAFRFRQRASYGDVLFV